MPNILDPAGAAVSAFRPEPSSPVAAHRGRRSIPELLAPLEKIAASSPNLIANHGASFELAGEVYEVPRYLFVGPKGGDKPIRVGIFAAIHGDEPEGAHTRSSNSIKLARRPNPELAQLVIVLSHLSGLQSDGLSRINTRHSRSGRDLNREFLEAIPRSLKSGAAPGRT
jgi:murein peptide amidase A